MNSMYLKVGNLRWTPNDRFAMEVGAVNQTNYIPFETFYGYRFMAETFQDRYYGITSSDLGVIAYYSISKKLSVDAAITNGEGPRVEQDNFGRIRLAGGLNFLPFEGLQTRVFCQLKSSGEPGYTATEQLFNAHVGYRAGERARFGAEIVYVNNYLGKPGLSTYGGTAFGCVTLYKSVCYLLRYDRLLVINPAEPVAGMPSSQNAWITGFSVNPFKGITLCLNYQGTFRLDQSIPVNHRILFSFEYRI
jgi:hypothetical protein